nr:hypothetical protein Iba_scaffold14348CG0010 [Ipomoea batatas]
MCAKAFCSSGSCRWHSFGGSYKGRACMDMGSTVASWGHKANIYSRSSTRPCKCEANCSWSFSQLGSS